LVQKLGSASAKIRYLTFGAFPLVALLGTKNLLGDSLSYAEFHLASSHIAEKTAPLKAQIFLGSNGTP
jgi:hypothetical protein